jgi:putative ABC transport system permease protein
MGIEQLQAELIALSGRLARDFPGTNAGLSIGARSLRSIYSGNVRPYLVLLTGSVVFVLLIACGNVINLLLSRGLSRHREMAIRFAMGANRRNVLLQLLTESLVLSVFAASLGIGLAHWWMRALRLQIGVVLPLGSPSILINEF